MKPQAYAYIRYSTSEQEFKDSERRQLEAAEAYAKEQELDLVVLLDGALSAFKSEHYQKGKLGQFFEDVETGKIKPGSKFIIERVDRLTREDLFEDRVKDLLRKGVQIYVTGTGNLWTKESWDIADEIKSAIERDLAYKESKQKSDRIKATWVQKTRGAHNGGKKLTGRCPFWLKLNRAGTKYEEIPERVGAVKLIFKFADKGYGKTLITKELNNHPTIWKPVPKELNKKSKGGWATSTIQKVLHSRAVLGEYQPHIKNIDTGGKREPVGDVILDYYPQVIDKELFDAVHYRFAEHRKNNPHVQGRTGKYKNIFRGVTKCGKCKSPMHFVDKGEGDQYLHCSLARQPKNGKSCSARTIRYDDFEKVFFKYIDELDVQELLPDPDDQRQRVDDLRRKLKANRKRLSEIDREKKRLVDFILQSDAEDWAELKVKRNEFDAEKQELQQANKDIDQELASLRDEIERLRKDRDSVKEYRAYLDNAETEEERIDRRSKLWVAIQNLIERMHVYPLEEPYKHLEEMKEEPGIFWHMESRYVDHFWVRFKGSTEHEALVRLKRTRVTGEHLWTGGVKPE
ncbi:MAG: recombinase family protein [Balneolales bacterium]